MATHAGKHVVADVLESNVHVLADIIVLTHHTEQVFREMGRICIMQTNPFYARYLSDFFDEFGQFLTLIEIYSVISQLLGNDLEFLDALRYQ